METNSAEVVTSPSELPDLLSYVEEDPAAGLQIRFPLPRYSFVYFSALNWETFGPGMKKKWN